MDAPTLARVRINTYTDHLYRLEHDTQTATFDREVVSETRQAGWSLAPCDADLNGHQLTLFLWPEPNQTYRVLPAVQAVPVRAAQRQRSA